jgi:hypothetical protein
MRILTLLMVIVFLSSCSAEQKIHKWSYTNEWYYEDNYRYQIYKTINGKKYIFVINEEKLILERKYLKTQ